MKWDQESSLVSGAHLDGARARLLCANLHGTTSSGKACSPGQTWEAWSRPWMDLGGNWDFREGDTMECPVHRLAERWCPRGWPGPSIQGPGNCTLSHAHAQMCHNYFFHSILVPGLLFWNKTGLLTSARGVGCYTKRGVSVSWVKKNLKSFWGSSRDVSRSWWLPELSVILHL